ncbi:MAG TPA: hypothetical protein PLB59_08065 [Bacteroidales bacterium]|nr:hypothetical protein [Bacteroidales bacterium]HPI30384.1 hypothetical protein [Bacteroidales bacterium]HQN16245.1 hypothetical protein [Bacteroidales bacterium]HQP15909.1 hypothetical protein [Bacteroidales bacterium]
MEQQENFEKIKSMYQQFVPPLSIMMETSERYDLYSAKEVEIKNRRYKEIYFGSVILKPKYTGFYFMPVYLFPEMLNEVPEILKKLQTGKSCFHIKKNDEQLFKAIEELMKAGFATYKKHKYV